MAPRSGAEDGVWSWGNIFFFFLFNYCDDCYVSVLIQEKQTNKNLVLDASVLNVKYYLPSGKVVRLSIFFLNFFFLLSKEEKNLNKQKKDFWSVCQSRGRYVIDRFVLAEMILAFYFLITCSLSKMRHRVVAETCGNSILICWFN